MLGKHAVAPHPSVGRTEPYPSEPTLPGQGRRLRAIGLTAADRGGTTASRPWDCVWWPPRPSVWAGSWSRSGRSFRTRAIPGVEAVGSTFAAPLGGSNVTGHLRDEGRPEPQPEDETSAGLRPSTREYLETMRIPVLRGRGLDPSDGRGAPHVALANERLVQEKLPH